MNGRHYQEDEALEFWLDGHAESEGVEDVEITDSLQKTWDKFGDAVDKSLEKHLTVEEYMAVTGSEGEESIKSDVYATLTGQGIGIWDGRWDGYMSGAKLDKIQKHLKKDVGKYADDAGGGKLNDEFYTAVYESSTEANPDVTIHRKGYTTKRGTYVKPTKFKIKDPGRPGVRSFGAKSATGKYAARRKMKPLITHEGTLGGAGYTKKSTATRHRLLSKCVKEFGYRSCLGKVQVLLISSTLKPATRRVLEADKKWLMAKYGGPGSFGSRGGKRRSKKKSSRSKRKNPSMGQIMRDAMK